MSREVVFYAFGLLALVFDLFYWYFFLKGYGWKLFGSILLFSSPLVSPKKTSKAERINLLLYAILAIIPVLIGFNIIPWIVFSSTMINIVNFLFSTKMK